MGRTAPTTPQAVIDDLARDFLIEDDREVMQFLERHPDVPALLLEIRGAIRRYFDEDRVKLEVFHDPEWPQEELTLLVNIQTHFAAGGALDRLKRFDREWWLEKLAACDAPLSVSIEHVRRV